MATGHNVQKLLYKQNYLANPTGKSLLKEDIPGLWAAQEMDRDGFFFNALNSFANFYISIQKQNYTWAIIQSYYTIFHLSRTCLAFNGYAMVYIGTTPYSVQISHGRFLEKIKGTGSTHIATFNELKKRLPNLFLLADKIEDEEPLDWFKKLREEVNYKSVPNEDPSPPRNFATIHDNLRQWLNTVIEDTTNIYCFSDQYAYFAYPTRFLSYVADMYRKRGLNCKALSKDKVQYLVPFFSDKMGSITSLTKLLKEISCTE
jgi:hypothetical protein